MTKTQDEFRPFYEIGFDFSHCLSIDHAVLAMLGQSKSPMYEITEAMKESEYEAYMQGNDEFDFESTLLEVLEDIKGAADTEYLDAYIKKVSQEKLEEAKEKIKKAHELIKTAYLFKCHIHDELAKGALSELRLANSSSPEAPCITLKSLSEWSSKHYRIELLPQLEPVPFRDLELDINQFVIDIKSGLTVDETRKTRITLALLVEALVDLDSDFKRNNKPNIKKIAEHIQLVSSKHSKEQQRSDSTIKKEIDKSFRSKEVNNSSESLSKTKATTLYIILAFMYEELVKSSFPNNSAPEDHVSTIADKLATRNTGLEGQELDSIIARIQKALDVRNNPDKRED